MDGELREMDEQRFDGRRVKRVATFWENNKSWLVPVIFTLAGGGITNADRLTEVAPAVVPASTTRVDDLEFRVVNLEKAVTECKCDEKATRDYDRPTE